MKILASGRRPCYTRITATYGDHHTRTPATDRHAAYWWPFFLWGSAMDVPIGTVLVALFSYGWVYDIFVIGRMNGIRARFHPLTALQVTVGVAVTLAGAWLADGECIQFVTLIACFAASGVPMIVGDIRRWYEVEEDARQH